MWKSRLFSLLIILGLCFSFSTTSLANADYEVTIADAADLLTDEEESALADVMQKSIKYGNVLFYTTTANPYYSTRTLSDSTYRSYYGDANGVAFVIDMDNRIIWVSGFGSLQYTVTDSYCETITDNVYTYASKAEYYICAEQAFSQISQLLHGKDIPQPMRYICNALLCVLLSLLLEFFFVMAVSRKRKANLASLKNSMDYHCEIQNAHPKYIRTTRVYSPPSDSSDSSFGGGGFSSGGGGSSSSGGGHRF